MKIYVVCDMEGASGLWMREQVDPSASRYGEGRELLTADVNAAVAGAFESGATEVVVCDSHGGGGNLSITRADARATYETPAETSPMPSLDESFAGLILVGQHAMAGTLNGFLDHTVNSRSWFEFRINGQCVGEIGIVAALAGDFGVPLIMVSGDEAACREAGEQFPGIVTVAVKRGLSRSRASCVHPERAHTLIQGGTAEALAKRHERKPCRLAAPVTAELTYYRSDYADASAARPGVERVDARTVRRVGETAADTLRF